MYLGDEQGWPGGVTGRWDGGGLCGGLRFGGRFFAAGGEIKFSGGWREGTSVVDVGGGCCCGLVGVPWGWPRAIYALDCVGSGLRDHRLGGGSKPRL